MGFLQKAFIRKKTPELIDKLVAMGYNYPMKYHKIFPNLLTIPYKGHGWGSLICVSDKEIDLALKTKINENPTIDCGDNEELFLAIAALRDDTDYMQWFTDGKLWEMVNSDLPSHYMQLEGHKATPEEIVNYFK
jgi:hypothetical protein